MTTHRTVTTHTNRAKAGRRLVPERHLPLVLRANATTSAAAGAVALAAPRWTAGTLGLDDTLWVRLVGAGLILFAGTVAASSRFRGRYLGRAATVLALGDLSWVLATAVVVTTGVLSGPGNIVAVLMALGVADFALLQLVLARRAD